MTEETNCYECDTPLVSVCPQCNPYLSAAPSPAGNEDEVESAIKWLQEKIDNKEYVYHPVDNVVIQKVLNAAISAMRPVPKLTEEDMARVEEISCWHASNLARFEHWNHDAGDGEVAFDNLSEALSLIDKLTRAK